MFNFTPENNSLFLVENPEVPLSNKKKLCDFLFGYYGIENLFLKNTASLASFLHSKENSVVIDLGGSSS